MQLRPAALVRSITVSSRALLVFAVATLGVASTNQATGLAGTDVGGIVATDTVWTEAGSPYLVTSTVQVPDGVTLTINPGVEVMNSGVPIYGDLFLLHGTITALGTKLDPIVFDGGGIANFFAAQSAPPTAFLDVQYAIIKNGAAFWPATGSPQPASFHLRDSVLEDLNSYSYVSYPESDVYIETNTFRNSAGFSVGLQDANVYVRWNTFESRPPGLPDYQDFWVSSWAAYGSSVTVVNNNSFLNAGNVAVEVQVGLTGSALDATSNYWGNNRHNGYRVDDSRRP